MQLHRNGKFAISYVVPIDQLTTVFSNLTVQTSKFRKVHASGVTEVVN